MKFKNPQGKEFAEVATMVGGLVVGAMASRALVSAIHTPTAGADATTAKKESTMLLVKRGAIIVASGYAGAGISGNDTTSTLAKAVCYGMAGMQAIDGVKDLAGKNAKLADTSTKTKRVIASTFGLACACDTPAPANQLFGARRRKSRGMGIIVETNNFNPVADFANTPTIVNSY